MIGTTAALITAGAMAAGSAGASVYGAKKQAGAARDAASIQAEAADRAGQLTRESAEQGANEITQAIPTTNGYMAGAADQANNLLSEWYRNYISGIEPYRAAGSEAVGQLGQLANGPGFQFSQDDPSYQFRMNEAMKALERSAAARGGASGGAALKSITRYSQDVASTEYGNAFNRFQQDRTARAGMLNNLIGAGQNANQQALGAGTFATGAMSDNWMGLGRFLASNSMAGTTSAAELRLRGAEGYGNALSNSAAARAAGQVGSANAWSSGLSGAANGAMNAGLLYTLLTKK